MEGRKFLPDEPELPPNITPGSSSQHPRLSLRGFDVLELQKTYRKLYDHMGIEVGQIQLQYTRQSMQLVQLLGISASGLKRSGFKCQSRLLLQASQFSQQRCREFKRPGKLLVNGADVSGGSSAMVLKSPLDPEEE